MGSRGSGRRGRSSPPKGHQPLWACADGTKEGPSKGTDAATASTAATPAIALKRRLRQPLIQGLSAPIWIAHDVHRRIDSPLFDSQ